jgi:histidinol-phosphatase (PHP family)
MIYTNYHSHTHHSDGKYAPEDYIQKAIQLGLKAYGFSDHAPVNFENRWSIRPNKHQEYINDVLAVKEKYSDQIDVYLSMEVDYIPGIIEPNDDFIKSLNLDYVLGSVHFVDFYDDGMPFSVDGLHNKYLVGLEQLFDNNSQRVVERYFELKREMVQKTKPHIVGHTDKIRLRSEDGNLFSEESQWYKDAIRHTLEVYKQEGTIVEINTRAIYRKRQIYPYPSKWVMQQLHELSIPIQINSDCHHPKDIISEFDQTAELLKTIGFKSLRVLLNGKWQDIGL